MNNPLHRFVYKEIIMTNPVHNSVLNFKKGLNYKTAKVHKPKEQIESIALNNHPYGRPSYEHYKYTTYKCCCSLKLLSLKKEPKCPL